MDMDLAFTFIENSKFTEIKCSKAGHPLTKHFVEPTADTSNQVCGKCSIPIDSIEKSMQKKTGLLKCNFCNNTEELYYCNQCMPKPQQNSDMGLNVDINSHCGFRIARHEAIFINSEHLEALSESEDILGTILSSHIVITDNRVSLLPIFEKLAQKMLLDSRWKECASVSFFKVERTTFDQAKKFITGEKILL